MATFEYTPAKENPFIEDDLRARDRRIVLKTTVEFWTPKREFFVTVTYGPLSKTWRFTAKSNESIDSIDRWTISVDNKIRAIKFLRGLSETSLKRAHEAISTLER